MIPPTPPTLPDPLALVRRLVRHETWRFVLSCVLWGLIHALPVLFGLLVKGLFDALADDAAAGAGPWTFLALAFALDLTRLGTMAGGAWHWGSYYLQTVLLLRRNLLAYLLTAPGSRRLPDSPGEAVTRFRDDVDDVAEYVEFWVDVWGLLVFAVAALVVMVRIDPPMTLLVLVPLVLTFVLTGALRPTIRRVRKASREATGRVTDFIGEVMGGVQAVKVAGREDDVMARFRGLNATRRRAALRDSLLTELFKSVTDNMVNVATGLILLLAASALGDGGFTVGDFALFVAYLPRLTNTVSFVGSMLVHHKRTAIAFERLVRLLQDAPAERIVEDADLGLDGGPTFVERRPEREPLERLEVRGLSYRYPDAPPERPGAPPAGIDGVDLVLERGSFTVVTGRVGAGKSTLLRALIGLLPGEGEILWNGRPVGDAASFFVPPRSAYLRQVPRLFSDTLHENVVLGHPDGERLLPWAVELSVLGPDLATLERGVHTPVGTRGVKLSGGQVQRSAAARMFMRQAELLVVDDLSSALDVETERALWEGLFAEGDVTCLVVSHRRAALERADRIVVLEEGRVAAQGTLDDLLVRSEALRGLWRGAREAA